MTDVAIFMVGVVVMAIVLAGTVATVLTGAVEEDWSETARPSSERAT